MEQHNEQQHTNSNKMERNLPFISISFLDKWYDKLVLSVTRKLDNGNIFKGIMVLLFHIQSFVLLLGVPIGFVAFAVMKFGDGSLILNILGFLVGLPIALFAAWYGYGIVRKRARQLYNEEFESILIFFFKKCIPQSLIIAGEVGAVFALASVLPMLCYGDPISSLTALIGGLGLLIGHYAIKDIYLYLYKIALSILTPLLIFAVAGGLAAGFSSAFSPGSEMIMGVFVTIVCLYIFFMLLKKHIFTQWHDK
tara:strand:- start:3709 stop:4464 length:756 start_codon:yes stop_codon:yes gene_type:complete